MIINEMRLYNYYTFGTYDEYGKPILTEQPQGTIKMAIYTLTQTTQNNPLYENSTYIGLTTDSKVNNTYVIEYEGNRLKVLYVQSKGKYKQVFLSNG